MRHATPPPPDVICTTPGCTLSIPSDAPVPLCLPHMQQAMAYCLIRAENVSDSVGLRHGIDRRAQPGWVYFIRKADLVKIGWTSHPERRFKELRPDEVLAKVPGTLRDEQRCHVAFKHLREHGEWFRMEADLLDFIGSLDLAA